MRSARFFGIALGLAALTALFLLSLRGQSGTPVTLLVWGGTIVTMDANGRVIPDGAVAIDGSRIVAVGSVDEVRLRSRWVITPARAAEVIRQAELEVELSAPPTSGYVGPRRLDPALAEFATAARRDGNTPDVVAFVPLRRAADEAVARLTRISGQREPLTRRLVAGLCPAHDGSAHGLRPSRRGRPRTPERRTAPPCARGQSATGHVP